MGNSVGNTFVVCGCANPGKACEYNTIEWQELWAPRNIEVNVCWCIVLGTCVAYHRNAYSARWCVWCDVRCFDEIKSRIDFN